jgi:uncharacterized protein (DUF983 family)
MARGKYQKATDDAFRLIGKISKGIGRAIKKGSRSARQAKPKPPRIVITCDCPHCGERSNLRASSIGKAYRCQRCRQQYVRLAPPVPTPAFPHGMHLLLSIVTCGLWIPIWIAHRIWRW